MTTTKYCVWDMGLLTDCGDDATNTRDGFPYCPQHTAVIDGLRKAERELEQLEKNRVEPREQTRWEYLYQHAANYVTTLGADQDTCERFPEWYADTYETSLPAEELALSLAQWHDIEEESSHV